MWSNWRKGLSCVIGCCLSFGLLAQIQNSNIQPKQNSPLSRFGLGDPVDQYLISASAMGGLGASWQNPYHLNMLNPASLASLQATAFEGGIYARNSKLQTNEASTTTWGGNLQYLALGFPLRNPINRTLDRQSNTWNAGMVIALQPMTQVGYDIQLVNTSDPELEVTTNSLKGTGGLYRLRWGTGWRYKGLSVGVNAGFLFGKLINSRLVTFDSLSSSLNTEFQDDVSVRGVTWDLGAQYAFEFTELNDKGEKEPTGRRLVLGLYGAPATGFRTETTGLTRRYFGTLLSDTLVNNTLQRGEGRFPLDWTAGLTYQNVNRFLVGVEAGMARWSNYQNDAKPEKLADTWTLKAGLEWVPQYNSYNNYLERVRYRLGGRIGADPRTLDGEQVDYWALTLGVGLPIILPRQQVSFLNIALEGGRLGVPDVYQETYFKISFGFTLNDNSWFFKRKFN